MESTTPWKRVRNFVRSFLDAAARANETVYLVMLTVYVVIYIIIMTAWSNPIKPLVSNIRYGLLSIVMWGAALYLLYVIIEWRKLWKQTVWIVLLSIIVLAGTFWFSRVMSTNAYGVVLDVFFCVMACGKNYKKILKVIMWSTIAMLIIAAVLLRFGLTYERPKLSGLPGHSLGIIYPNNWGYAVFLVLMTGWYAYLRRKPLLYFIISWGLSAFMFFYVQCRTIALLTIVFPVMALFVDWLEARPAKARKGIGVIGWFWTITPILALVFVLFVSMNYEWVSANVPDNSLIGTIKYRFVHNGLYLKTYKVKFVGNAYNSNYRSYVNVNGDFLEPGILDCSYVSYVIMRGALWLGYTMLWLCIANYRAYKRRDYAINILSAILLVFAMIERVGLEMWYNFVLLYPLAAVSAGVLRSQPSEPVILAEETTVESILPKNSDETVPGEMGEDEPERSDEAETQDAVIPQAVDEDRPEGTNQ